ncbi:UNVERIFIED_CONTAM: hypothetical protein RMT77_001945 [Armadillidium vulgare]
MDLIFPINKSSDYALNEDNIFNFQSKYVMIIGPSVSYKTSLLMQAAVTEAHNGKKVLFVSPQKLTKLTPAVHGMKEPTSLIMKNIQFLYAKNITELQGYLSSVHLKPPSDQMSVTIVDEINHYCKDDSKDSLNELVSLSKISSLISDATFFPHNIEKDGRVLLSWNLSDQNCVLKSADLQRFSEKIYDQVWNVYSKRKSESSESFEIKNGEFLLTFSHKSINPRTQLIFLQDIFVEDKQK